MSAPANARIRGSAIAWHGELLGPRPPGDAKPTFRGSHVKAVGVRRWRPEDTAYRRGAARRSAPGPVPVLFPAREGA